MRFLRNSREVLRLLRPLARYRVGGFYVRGASAPQPTHFRRLLGRCRALSASCHHHMGNFAYAKELYDDINAKARRGMFFNKDTTEFLLAYTKWAGERVVVHRDFHLRKVNVLLRHTFSLAED